MLMRFSLRVLLALSVICPVALATSPAHARRTVVIEGGGWGHGIGMSQYGAYGRARRGHDATRILTHYYSGTRVRRETMPGRIRVGLIQYRETLSAAAAGQTQGDGTTVFKLKGRRKPLARGSMATDWRVEASPTGGMRLYRNGEQVKVGGVSVFGEAATPLVLQYEPYGTIVDLGEKPYDYAHGRLEFGTHASDRCRPGYCLRLVLAIPMQKYLYGLGEVPSSWPAPALEAQAIAARTYAFEKHTRTGDHRDPCDCTVYDSTYDQAYVGDAKRTGSGEYWDDWKGAVDATEERVVLYKGDPIQALYSSSSGGHTENNENVWGGTPMPYLRGVRDGADDVGVNPNHSWEVTMPYRTFASKLEKAYGIGELRRFRLVKPFGVSGRVTVVNDDDSGGARVEGSGKTVRVSGWSLRSALGLKDTLFRVQIEYPVAEEFRAAHADLTQRPRGGPGPARSRGYAVPKEGPAKGKAQDFATGRMTWIASERRVVWQWGAVLAAYDRWGREGSSLGLPSSGIWGPGRFRAAHYGNGLIVWSKTTRAHSVRGHFDDAYRRAGGPKGPLGLPVAERASARQRFQDGYLYASADRTRAYALWGEIADRYQALGGPRSSCGRPTRSMRAGESGARASFEKGTITWSPDAGLQVDCD